MKDTQKNKTKNVLNIPTTPYYTIEQLFQSNTHFPAKITVRVRHTKAIESGNVAEIGNLVGGKGRPQKVFAKTPVTELLLQKAETDGINLVDNAKMLINAVSVTTPTVVNKSTLSPA